MRNIKTNFGTDKEEFKHYVGRYPKGKREMDEWIHYMQKGIEAQLDWDTICKCASENFVK